MTEPRVDPQDPYVSVLVPASAGSGKTYQLARRFIALVAAGARPESIITVTFTIKAAGEMQSRILAEAGALLARPEEQRRLELDMQRFHAAAAARLKTRLAPPISPEEAARSILSSSQVLKITTIDALFLEWVAKFPAESGLDAKSPITLFDPAREREWDDLAFRQIARRVANALRNGATTPELTRLLSQGFHDARMKLASLSRHESFVWQAEQRMGRPALVPHPLDEALAGITDDALVGTLSRELSAVARAVVSNQEKLEKTLQAIAARDLHGLFAAQFLARSTSAVSGTLLRSDAKRASVQSELRRIEEVLRGAVDARRLAELNATGSAYYHLFEAYRDARTAEKTREGGVEFRDLTKGCYHLLHGDDGLGVRFLFGRTFRHLLLDEFQDTSRLQWSIFSSLASLLLEDASQIDDGASGAPPSVFLVGDVKQSIYGFREADPSVLGEAREKFSAHLAVCPLNVSYRTSQVVLDAVNRTFASPRATLTGFSPHSTAAANGKPFVPDVGTVLLSPLVKDTAAEATLIAALLDQALKSALPCPVYDKGEKRFRSLAPGDCAVLYRGAKVADEIDRALRDAGIPCQREEPRGFFERGEVFDAVALLRFLAWPSDAVSLLTILRSPLGRVSDRDMLRLVEMTSVSRRARPLAIIDALSEPYPRLAKALRNLLVRRGNTLPHELLSDALVALDAREAYASLGDERSLAARNLTRLTELILDIEAAAGGSLTRVVRRLEQLAKDDETGNAPTGGHAVTLMTIHKAKGLEFPLVVIADMGRPWAKSDPYWTPLPTEQAIYFVGKKDDRPQYDGPFNGLVRHAEHALIDESHRLLYVAMTRARQYLFMTGHNPTRPDGLPASTAYPLVADAMAGADTTHLVGGVELRRSSTVTSTAIWEAAFQEVLTPKVLPLVVKGNAALPTGVRNLAPSRRREAAENGSAPSGVTLDPRFGSATANAIGIAFHAAMDAHFKGKSFDAALAWRRLSGATPDGFAELERQIKTALASDVLQAVTKHHKCEPELPIIHRVEEGMVRGSIDLLVRAPDGTATVIDYKTTTFAQEHDPSETMLRAFASERGYVTQLETYMKAVRALYPQARVRGALYFSGVDRIVFV